MQNMNTYKTTKKQDTGRRKEIYEKSSENNKQK